MTVLGPPSAGGLPPSRSGTEKPVQAPHGPTPGTAETFARLLDVYAYDINIRLRDSGRGDVGESFQAQDITLPPDAGSFSGPYAPSMAPFEVYQDNRVKVTATLVDHRPVYPSLAFRFDTD